MSAERTARNAPPLTLADLRDRATITVEEAAGLLTLSRTSAYDAARRGDIPVIRLGRRVVVPAPALLRMLTADEPPAA